MKHIYTILTIILSFSSLYANYLPFNDIKKAQIASYDLGDIKMTFTEENKPGNCTTPVEVGADEAFDFIASKHPIIIDIRTPAEYTAERLENVSYNIDYYAPDFKEKLNLLDKDAKYLIYCRTGHRSGLALEIMKELGFRDIHHIKGGITDWKARGYPTVKGESAR